MATSPTKRGTRKLSEVARHIVQPSGIVSTGYPAVAAKCRDIGIEHDEWQAGLGRLILAKRADGKYAATVGGVVMSIPRQVGKTFLVGSIIFALCLLNPGMTVLWTAHRTRTASETFAKMKATSQRRKIKPLTLDPRSTNGEQEIRFRNGSRILFGAREAGFGRGFDEVDIEVFDEAQILTERALEDMIAATNQSRQAAGALLFYMGTPPRPIDPGEVFTNKRAECLSGDEHDTIYVELSADADCGKPGGPSLDDRAQWEKGNPSYPDRTPLESMLRLRKNVGSDESWRREGLGIWDEMRAAWAVVDPKKWEALGVLAAPDGGVPCYGVKFSVDGRTAALAASVKVGGVVHAEVVKHRSMVHGVDWLAEWLAARTGTAAEFVIDGKAGRDDLVAALRRLKVPPAMIRLLSTDEVIQAHTSLLAAVNTGGMTHAAVEGQAPLDEAVAVAGKRKIGTAGGWGWSPLDGSTDMTPLDAVTLAHYSAATTKRKARGAGRSSGRRAVVLS